MTHYAIIGKGALGQALSATLAERGHHVTTLERGQSHDMVTTLEGVDVIVEATTEDLSGKVDVLGRLRACSAPVLTTTSSFTVDQLSAASGLAGRLAGFHHLAPYGGRLAELVTAHSDPSAARAARQLADDLGVAHLETPDVPGRISRRLLAPFVENALRAVELGIAKSDEVDQIITLGLGHQVGPLRRVREAGIDEHRAVVAALNSTAASPPTAPTSPRGEAL